jgi:hypothetical protein
MSTHQPDDWAEIDAPEVTLREMPNVRHADGRTMWTCRGQGAQGYGPSEADARADWQRWNADRIPRFV